MIGLFAVLFFLLGKVYECVLDVFATHFGVDLWASAGGNGDRRHSVYRDLPDVPAALQYSAGYCGDCRTVVMASIWAKCAHRWYFRTFPSSAHRSRYDVRHGLEKLHQ